MGVRLPAKVLAIMAFALAFLFLVFLVLYVAVRVAGILLAVAEGEGVAGDGGPAGSGAGGSEQVVFASNWEGSPQLYVMDVSTGAWKRISSGSGNPTSPVFSPDGERVAFSDGGDIYTINAGGYGEPERIVSTPSLDYAPAWSPDGAEIAYACKDEAGADICLASADGETERIERPDTEDYDPTYSPDGGTIVYSGERELGGETSGDLYAVSAEDPAGDEPERLTEPVPGVRRFDAAFSPGGEVLAFASNRRGGDYDVFLMRPTAADREEAQINLTADEQDNFSPSFSPDGEEIVYTEDAATDVNLLVMSADGHDKRRIADSPAVERQPNWRPTPPTPSAPPPEADPQGSELRASRGAQNG